MRVLVAAALGLLVAGSADAQFSVRIDGCTPTEIEPQCLGRLRVFGIDDDYAVQRCRRDLQDFVQAMEVAKSCIASTARLATVETDAASKDAVRKFNCIVRGGIVC